MNGKSLGHATLPITDIVRDSISKEYLAWFGGPGFESRPFLIYQPSKINQKPITVSLPS